MNYTLFINHLQGFLDISKNMKIKQLIKHLNRWFRDQIHGLLTMK